MLCPKITFIIHLQIINFLAVIVQPQTVFRANVILLNPEIKSGLMQPRFVPTENILRIKILIVILQSIF